MFYMENFLFGIKSVEGEVTKYNLQKATVFKDNGDWSPIVENAVTLFLENLESSFGTHSTTEEY